MQNKCLRICHVGFSVAWCLSLLIMGNFSLGCSRFVYQGSPQNYYTGRSVDWFEDMKTDMWAYPKGMKKDGGTGSGAIKWTSKYGSVTTSVYDVATIDGINEKGLVAGLLYLAEAKYPEASSKPTLSAGAWAQYVLDKFASVKEAVTALKKDPFTLIAPALPDGKPTTIHLSISDPQGDSAIFEYINGKLVIHHGKQYKVMTNSPTYDEQTSLANYWMDIGGDKMLPGTSRAADRFVRATYYLSVVPAFDDERKATAAAISIIRNLSVPMGVNDPHAPNIATTLWRTISDHSKKRYYFDSALSPNVFWVDLKNLDFSQGQAPKKLALRDHPILAGDQSASFKEAEPFKWLK
ncbi:MAG: linear amide C-N hydrolase [Cellvibrionales bacterium]|nr:linear amide C-N hydrolase [Cellvibrionales bacterium]